MYVLVVCPSEQYEHHSEKGSQTSDEGKACVQVNQQERIVLRLLSVEFII